MSVILNVETIINYSEENSILQGGRDDIIRIGNRVHRPVGTWTKQVHALLQYLRNKGFYGAPEPFGFDKHGREIVNFIEGTVVNSLSSGSAGSSRQTLISAAHLLRDYHDASQGFLETLSADDLPRWQLHKLGVV